MKVFSYLSVSYEDLNNMTVWRHLFTRRSTKCRAKFRTGFPTSRESSTHSSVHCRPFDWNQTVL